MRVMPQLEALRIISKLSKNYIKVYSEIFLHKFSKKKTSSCSKGNYFNKIKFCQIDRENLTLLSWDRIYLFAVYNQKSYNYLLKMLVILLASYWILHITEIINIKIIDQGGKKPKLWYLSFGLRSDLPPSLLCKSHYYFNS